MLDRPREVDNQELQRKGRRVLAKNAEVGQEKEWEKWIVGMDENECSKLIIGAAIEVHRHLGPGLLESAYEQALCHELGLRAVRVSRQIKLPVRYKTIELSDAYRLDLLVEDLVVVELKALESLASIHEVQLLPTCVSRVRNSACC